MTQSANDRQISVRFEIFRIFSVIAQGLVVALAHHTRGYLRVPNHNAQFAESAVATEQEAFG